MIEYLLSLELGGTSIKALLISKNEYLSTSIHDIFKLETIKEFSVHTTNNPHQTIKDLTDQILNFISFINGKVIKVGIGSFGPLGLNIKKDYYGFITTPPKEGWQMLDLLSTLSKYLNISKEHFTLETDVNAAVMLEYKYGNHNKDSIAYITIGTGCGIGIISEGNIIHGLQHTEGGHIFIKKDILDKDFNGVCKYHSDCAEGLISNIAIKQRMQLSSVDEIIQLSDTDTIWDLEAYYISQICLNLLYLVSIEKIIIGGGIINREILLPKIQKQLQSLNSNYIDHPQLSDENIKSFIIRTEFKNNTGLLAGLSIIKLEV